MAYVWQDPDQIQKHGTRGASYFVRWNDLEGKQRSKSCGPGIDGKRKAESLLREIQADLQSKRVKRPRTAYPFQGERTKRKYEALERQHDSGEWWISPGLASARTGHTRNTLDHMSKAEHGGSEALGGKTLRRNPLKSGIGRTDKFYSEKEITRLIKAESNIPVNPTKRGFDRIEKAAIDFGVSVKLIYDLREAGEVNVLTIRGRTKRGHIRETVLVRCKDLRAYNAKRKAGFVPKDKIPLAKAASLLGIQRSGMAKLAKRKGWKITEGKCAANGHVSQCKLLKKKDVESERSVRETLVGWGKPAHWGGFTWSTAALLGRRVKAEYVSRLCYFYRQGSCPLLDGRKSRKGIHVPSAQRPMLALLLPSRGHGREESWHYCDADGELIKGRLEGTLTAAEAKKRAAEILELCKAALLKTPVQCNFAALEANHETLLRDEAEQFQRIEDCAPVQPRRKGRGRPKGSTSPGVKSRDEQMVNAWRADQLLPEDLRRYEGVSDLAEHFVVQKTYAYKVLRESEK